MPTDPPGGPNDLLEAALSTLNQSGVAALPTFEGLDGFVVGRWLVRAALSQSRAWRPLHQLDLSRPPDPQIVQDAAELAAGGWLLYRGPPSDMLRAACATQEAALLLIDAGPTVGPPAAWVARLQWLDPGHAIAIDPSLGELRRSLLAHCRSAGAIHLSGPPGVGKRALAAWAHAELDNEPASWLFPGGERRPESGRWQIYGDLGELSPDQCFHLRRRLDELSREVRPQPTTGGPAVPRPQSSAFAAILGESPRLSAVLHTADLAAHSELSALILGEPGSGKERLARAIHDASGRRGPFWAVDLAAMNEELVESELFGHRKGAFTGAERDRMGAFRQADGGTLFLDELGNLSPRVQGKLLRALQERVVQPVGDDRQIAVNVRVITATHADLDAMVSRGEFREDLLRRLDGVRLRLPPLRERGSDILLLARSLLPSPPPEIDSDAARILLTYEWPGNVRELSNVVRQAALAASPGPIRPEHLGPLAPDRRRDTPLLTLSADPELTRQGLPGLPRSLLHRLCAVTLRVPELRERGALSLRGILLHHFAGHPVRPEVITELSRRPWWGNLPELAAAVEALRVSAPGGVDLSTVERVLPAPATTTPPIRVLLFPNRGADGRIGGFVQDFPEGALLIGRATSLPDLERAWLNHPEGPARLSELRQHLGSIQPGALHLPLLPQLSRAHLLVRRVAEGLEVLALRGARWPVRVRALMENLHSGQELVAGGRANLGPAGAIRLETPGSPPLELFLFSGALAFEEHAQRAVVGPEPQQETRVSELSPPVEVGVEDNLPESRRPRLWVAESAEIEALNGIVARHRGGDFAADLVSGLSPLANDPALKRLCTYVLGVRPTQYCARLYEHPPNRGLREDLARRLASLPDPAALLAHFPLGIQRAVAPLLD